MSDLAVLQHLTISQANRSYFYPWKNQAPSPPQEIASQSANMHMIPANELIAKQLKRVRQGDVVHLRGHLVQVTAPDGWFWNSSMSREDTGDGACELVRVDSVEVR